MFCSFLPAPVEGQVRLVNGDIDHGRVEVFHAGTFGTICDDYWTHEVAQVRGKYY